MKASFKHDMQEVFSYGDLSPFLSNQSPNFVNILYHLRGNIKSSIYRKIYKLRLGIVPKLVKKNINKSTEESTRSQDAKETSGQGLPPNILTLAYELDINSIPS